MRIEELQEGLADHETRILALEGSHQYREGESPQERLALVEKILNQTSTPNLWSPSQWEKVEQLEAKLLFLERKLNEHLDKPKTPARKQPKHTFDKIEEV